MAQSIKPFKATYYNPLVFKNYSYLVCPPYDVISPAQLKGLRKKSAYNFSWVLIAEGGNYQQAGLRLKQWLKDQILIEDKSDSLYLYEQTFKINGKTLRRFGMLSLLNMDKKGIFPHEQTLSAPKRDRRKIITATKANLSPIFVIAARQLSQLKKIYQKYRRLKPFFKCYDQELNLNKIWKISSRQEIAKLCREISASRMVIADGHHRFETTFAYFKKNKGHFKDLNYILAYLTGPQPGLVILPTHRIIATSKAINFILARLEKYFSIKAISQRELEDKLKSKAIFCFGIYQRGKFYFLELKNNKLLDKISNKLYRKLDTYIFHQSILPLLAIGGNIEYTHNISEAKQIAGKNKTAFLLRAVPLTTVLKIAGKGLCFPQKSTYFYPKILSGLVIRRFQPR